MDDDSKTAVQRQKNRNKKEKLQRKCDELATLLKKKIHKQEKT